MNYPYQLPGDERRREVCIKCVNCYINHDGHQCRLEPHANPGKHSGVCAWLRSPYAYNCPEFRKVPSAQVQAPER